MKKTIVILIILACSGSFAAQEPLRKDSSKIGHKPGDHGTDSVRSGNQIFHGGNGKAVEPQKNKPPKKTNSAPTGTHTGSTPKYPR